MISQLTLPEPPRDHRLEVLARLAGRMIKALSLWEPWASLMALGPKAIETRHWWTRYRGPLLICAARRRPAAELEEVLSVPGFQRALAPLAGGGRVRAEHLGFGNALAIVELIRCSTTERCRQTGLAAGEDLFGDFSPGRFGWITADLIRIQPFPVVGRQGLFNVELPSPLLPFQAPQGAREGVPNGYAP